MLRALPKNEYNTLISGAKLLEMNRHGPKVYATKDGRIVKLFRVKWLSSNLIQSYARRFAGNASALVRNGVAAPPVEFFGKVPHIDRQIVIYRMMPGTSLRDALHRADPAEAGELMRRFGVFLAQLYEKGIIFRSLHFGNVLVDGDGMGLIDFLDLKISPARLDEKRRLDNLRFLVKYPQDRAMMHAHLNLMREGYDSVSPGDQRYFAKLGNLVKPRGEAS